jgi:hypothetical protein
MATDTVGAAASGCDTLHVTVRRLANPGGQFVFDVLRGACPTSLDAGAAAGSCEGEADRYDWFTDFTGTNANGAVGECPCSSDAWVGAVQCTDDTQRDYVRVRRAAGAPPSCDTYALELSNGKYHGPYP